MRRTAGIVRARVGCAVLAAGAGVRFGRPGEKLLAIVSEKPLLQHAIDASCASLASTCSVVLGAASEDVLVRIDVRRAAVFVNAGWEEGQASSIRLAIAVHDRDDACILMLGDQPNVTQSDLNALVEEHVFHPRAIVALRSGPVWGAPVLFPSRDYPALLKLHGDRGAKRYAQSQKARVRFVNSVRADAFIDYDARADLTPPSARRTTRTRPSPARR
jgi:molybdenum cofactor cytidylyltransferase